MSAFTQYFVIILVALSLMDFIAIAGKFFFPVERLADYQGS
jgi:hypothetical protein